MSKRSNRGKHATAGKNPAAVDFTAEIDEGITLRDELWEILEEDRRAISWMMNAIVKAKAAEAMGLTRAKIRDHMKLVHQQIEDLIFNLENPTWWDLLLPELDPAEMKDAGYWPGGLPDSPENREKQRWRMIESNMLNRLSFLQNLADRALVVSEQSDPKRERQPHWPAYALARAIEEGIREGILPLTETHEQSVAQELFSIALKAAGIKARKSLRYYLAGDV